MKSFLTRSLLNQNNKRLIFTIQARNFGPKGKAGGGGGAGGPPVAPYVPPPRKTTAFEGLV